MSTKLRKASRNAKRLIRGWDESKHPRNPKGTDGGGRFRSKADAPEAAKKAAKVAAERPIGKAASTRTMSSARKARAGGGRLSKADLAKSGTRSKTAAEVSAAVSRSQSVRDGSPDAARTRWRKGLTWRTYVDEGKDTRHMHVVGDPDSGVYEYTPERSRFHMREIDKVLSRGKPGQAEPETLFMAGGPASGKSTILKSGAVTRPPDAVDINADDFKQVIPEYQSMIDAGDPRAAGFVHEESSDMVAKTTFLSEEGRYHSVVDGTGNSGDRKFAGKIQKALAAGRRVRVVYATIDVDEAVRRSDARANDPESDSFGRHVDPEIIRKSHRGVSRNFPDVAMIPEAEVELYDTSERGKPRLLASKARGEKLVVHDQAGFEAFLQKGDVTWRP